MVKMVFCSKIYNYPPILYILYVWFDNVRSLSHPNSKVNCVMLTTVYYYSYKVTTLTCVNIGADINVG